MVVLDVLVSGQLLHGANVIAGFEQVGEAVAERVRPDRFDDAGGLRGLAHRFLHGALAGVPAVDDAGAGRGDRERAGR